MTVSVLHGYQLSPDGVTGAALPLADICRHGAIADKSWQTFGAITRCKRLRDTGRISCWEGRRVTEADYRPGKMASP
jgi:hypothetical protein